MERRRSASSGIRRRRCRASAAKPRPRVSLLAGGANSICISARKALAPGRVEFEVPPGPIDLEIAVEDASAEVLDREITKDRRPEPRSRTHAEHAGGVPRPHAPRVAVARGRCRRRCRSSSVNSAVPIACLFASAAQSANSTPVLTARMLNREGGEMSVLPMTPAGFRRVESDRRPALGAAARRVPHRGHRQRRPGAGVHTRRLPSHPVTLRLRAGSFGARTIWKALVVLGFLARVRRGRRRAMARPLSGRIVRAALCARERCPTATSPSAGSNTRGSSSRTWESDGRPIIHFPSATS